jgi:hypothetical protein
MHSAASACSFTVGDPKLSDICYFLKERLWRLYSKYVLFVIMCYYLQTEDGKCNRKNSNYSFRGI